MVIVETSAFTKQVLQFMYPKNVRDDLTPDQLRALRQIVEKEYP